LRVVPGDLEERYWVDLGLLPRTARSLVKAGIRSVADLAGWSREQLADLPWMGKRSLARLEQLWGSPLPSRKGFWEARGVPPLIRSALLRAGIDSLEKLGTLTREQFLAINGLGKKALRECERLLGRPLDAPYRDWRQMGLRPRVAYRLARAGLRTLWELQVQPLPALRAAGLTWEEIEHCRAMAELLARHQESRP
jgi:hypothetical protein